VRAQQQLQQTAGKGCGCLTIGSGCLVLPVVCVLLVPAIFLVFFNSDDSSADAATSGFSAAAFEDIPAEYLQLYQAAAAAYPGLPAPLLAAVGKTESDHGRALGAGVHQPAHPDHLLGSRGRDDTALANYAGAAGPMQIGIGGAATSNFQGSHAWGSPWDGTWHGAIHPAPPPDAPVAAYGYGVDAGGDGLANVYDPADAIFTGARMLYTAWDKNPNNLWKAVYAYNHGGGAPDRRDDYVTKVGDFYNQYLGLNQSLGLTVTPECTRNAAPEGINGALGQRIVAYACTWLRTPYQFGGGDRSGPTVGQNSRGDGALGFDCSGLTLYAVYQATGGRVSLYHHVQEQFSDPHVRAVPSLAELQPGDLIALHGWGHVGIYIGGGKMIHAPHTGDVVKISDITKGWYHDSFITGGRVVL
jgi:cell wall-associated NlpC family hydrolase